MDWITLPAENLSVAFDLDKDELKIPGIFLVTSLPPGTFTEAMKASVPSLFI